MCPKHSILNKTCSKKSISSEANTKIKRTNMTGHNIHDYRVMIVGLNTENKNTGRKRQKGTEEIR